MSDFLDRVKAQTQKANDDKEAARKEGERQRALEWQKKKDDALAKVPEKIASIQAAIEWASKNGETSVEHFITSNSRFYHNDDLEDIYGPVWNKLMVHFNDLGFKAELDLEHTTNYGSDGAGPGPTNYRVKVSWDD